MGARRFVAVLLVLPMGVFAQANRYIVTFKDKNSTPYSIDQPEAFLSQKSIDRRKKQNISIVAADLPVNPVYVSQVRATGARMYFSSRWMNAVLIQIGHDSLSKLTSLPFVSKVELVAPGTKLPGGRTINARKFGQTSLSAETTDVQLQQLGLDEMQSLGYHGETMTIALLDGGFLGANTASAFSHLYQDNKIKGTFDFVGLSGNVYQYDQHGTEVLSTIAGLVPGSFTGGAPQTNFYLYVTEDGSSEYRIEEYNWLFAAERADSVGVDIISSSLGYNTFDDPSMDYLQSDLDGKTAVVSRAATEAVNRGIVVVCSAGNEGSTAWRFVTAPADANGVLACGAISSGEVLAPFSSIGPTADGRHKPDVVAMGYGTSVVTPSGAVGIASGTSFACPLVASLVAGVWQKFSDLTAVDVYYAIIRSADQAYAPDNKKGYGLPSFRAVSNYLQASELDGDIAVYPNPIQGGLLQIRLRNPTDQPVTVTVYDVLGRALSESTVNLNWRNNPITIDVDGMTSGVYLLKIKSAEVAKTLRWVKG